MLAAAAYPVMLLSLQNRSQNSSMTIQADSVRRRAAYYVRCIARSARPLSLPRQAGSYARLGSRGVYAMAGRAGPSSQPPLLNRLFVGAPCMCRMLSVAVGGLKPGCRPPIAHAAGMLGSTYRMRPGGAGSMYVTPLASGK